MGHPILSDTGWATRRSVQFCSLYWQLEPSVLHWRRKIDAAAYRPAPWISSFWIYRGYETFGSRVFLVFLPVGFLTAFFWIPPTAARAGGVGIPGLQK